MSFWANVVWANVLLGKRRMGKCLWVNVSGQMSYGQMSWNHYIKSRCPQKGFEGLRFNVQCTTIDYIYSMVLLTLKIRPSLLNSLSCAIYESLSFSISISQEPLNQRTYHADDFVLAPIVVVITH
jgi:hypothetical protein